MTQGWGRSENGPKGIEMLDEGLFNGFIMDKDVLKRDQVGSNNTR